jgi:hypothetical protein
MGLEQIEAETRLPLVKSLWSNRLRARSWSRCWRIMGETI